MSNFRKGLAVVSLCAAMLVGAGRSGPVPNHSRRATLDDSLLTTIINAIVDLESRVSIPPG